MVPRCILGRLNARAAMLENELPTFWPTRTQQPALYGPPPRMIFEAMSSHGTSLEENNQQAVHPSSIDIKHTELHRVILRQILQVTCLHAH